MKLVTLFIAVILANYSLAQIPPLSVEISLTASDTTPEVGDTVLFNVNIKNLSQQDSFRVYYTVHHEINILDSSDTSESIIYIKKNNFYANEITAIINGCDTSYLQYTLYLRVTIENLTGQSNSSIIELVVFNVDINDLYIIDFIKTPMCQDAACPVYEIRRCSGAIVDTVSLIGSIPESLVVVIISEKHLVYGRINKIFIPLWGDSAKIFYVDSISSRKCNVPIDKNNMGRASIYPISVSPNPFKSNTTIKYNMPELGVGELKIYDIAGRMVFLRSINGSGQVNWTPELAVNGVYFIKVTVGKKTYSRKLVLQR